MTCFQRSPDPTNAPFRVNAVSPCTFFAVAAAMVAMIAGPRVARAGPATKESQRFAVLVHLANIEGNFSWRSAPFSGDGRRLVTFSKWPNRTVRVWDVSTWKPLAPPIRQRDVRDCQLTADGETLFINDGDNHVGIWDVHTSTMRSLTAIGHDLLVAWFSPDGTRFLTKSWNVSKLQLWRAGEAKPFADLEHSEPVTFATFDPSGARIVTREWTAGESVHIWDAKTGVESCDPVESDFDSQADVAQTADFDATGKRLAIARKFGFAMVEPATGKVRATGHNQGDVETYSVQLSADGSTVVVVVIPALRNPPGPVQVFDSATGKLLRSFAQDSHICAISRNGRWFFRASFESDSTEVWDVSSGSKVQTLTNVVGALAPSPDGMTIAIGGKDKVSIWRIREEGQVPPSK